MLQQTLKKIKALKKNNDLINELESQCVRKTYQKNEILIKQGQIGSSIFIVAKGTVDAVVKKFDKETVVHTFQSGSRFGERTAFRNDEECLASCVVSSDTCSLYELTSEKLAKVLSKILAPLKLSDDRCIYGKYKCGNRIACYQGIRYATAGRFEKPVLCDLNCSEYSLKIVSGPSCPQVSDMLISSSLPLPKAKSLPHNLFFLANDKLPASVMLGMDKQPQLEDCLNLNVYCSATDLDKLKPVMVFIHGGAFVTGSGSDGIYEASELALKDVVVVLINYRLGALGFLDAPGIPCNLGLQDQLTALMWVQKHIIHFGGDCNNVTVFGESAGGMSIGCLVGSPMRINNEIGRTLFHKAIPQSGAALNALSHQQGANTAELFAEILGLSRETLSINAVNFPLEDIVSASTTLGLSSTSRDDLYGKFMAFQPVVCDEVSRDPVFLGQDPSSAISKGIAKDVRVLTGTTKDEYALFMAMGLGGEKSFLRHGLSRSGFVKRFSTMIENFLNDTSRYEHVTDHSERAKQLIHMNLPAGDKKGNLTKEEIHQTIEEFYTTWLFELPCLRFAEAQSKYNDVYLYRLELESPLPKMKSCHALDLPLVFGTYKHPMIQMFSGNSEKVAKVSQSMQTAWTSFAKTGVPQGIDIKTWPTYDQSHIQEVRFGMGNTGNEGIGTISSDFVKLWSGICVTKL